MSAKSANNFSKFLSYLDFEKFSNDIERLYINLFISTSENFLLNMEFYKKYKKYEKAILIKKRIKKLNNDD